MFGAVWESAYPNDGLLEAFETHLGGVVLISRYAGYGDYATSAVVVVLTEDRVDLVESGEGQCSAPRKDDDEYSIRMWLSSW